jgi:hypothetical protein
MKPFLGILPVVAICAACSTTAPDADVTRVSANGQTPAPPGAAPGTCWSKRTEPAVIETVTQQNLVQPAEILDDGTVISPALYRTETLQRIVRERRETWFETPCPEVQDSEFLASLQRALKARGYHVGPVTGTYDWLTRRAVQTYQKEQGLDSATLSLAAARQLGLVAYDPSLIPPTPDI